MGEVVLVEKVVEFLLEEMFLVERLNMVYVGSFVIFGQGIGVVVVIVNVMEMG